MAVPETQFELRLKAILAGYSLPGSLITMGTTTLRVYLKDAAGDVLHAEGNVVPTATATGYAKGCLFVKNDAATTVRGLYENIGTKTSCIFQKVGGARAVDIELTAGKIIFGVAPGVGAEKTLSIGPALTLPKMFVYTDPAAAGVSVHAEVDENDVNAFPGPFTDPVIPRNIKVVFDAGWQGGDVTVIGTDQFDAAVTEVIADVAGTTVVGVKIFKTVVSASKEIQAGAGDGCQIFTGDKLGILDIITDVYGFLSVAGVTEVVVIDTTYHGFTPTTVPDGAKDYVLLANVSHAHTVVMT